MKVSKKMQMPIAIKDRTEQNLSSQHITTTDFMQIGVAKCMEVVPNQRLDVQHQCFMRLEPLPVPTFGRAKVHNRAFYVPFRTIWKPWDNFINDTPFIDSSGTPQIPQNVPFFSRTSFISCFVNPDYGLTEITQSSYDFILVTYNQLGEVVGAKEYAFTAKGRFAYKLLRQLGYNFPFVEVPTTIRDGEYKSALPLLALVRVYVDFYYNSQYMNDGMSSALIHLLSNTDELSTETSYIDENMLSAIIDTLYRISYVDDYFVNAWDNPNTPNEGLSSSVVIEELTGSENYVDYNNFTEGDPTIHNESESYISRISQYMLNSLRSLTDYLKRNQIVGSRALDRYLARFGVKLPAEKLNRCEYLGEFVQEIQFGDVTSTSDTEGAQLGAYAGKGISYGNGHFNVEFDEFGMFIIVSTIIPDTSYYQGINRHVNHITKLDFYTPEFDNLGTQALTAEEVYVPTDATSYDYHLEYPNQVFGFVPRYSEYKVPYNQITGDYIVSSLNTGKEAWTLARNIENYLDVSNIMLKDLVHSPDFVKSLDSEQFNRIFYNTDNSADHFNVIHDFNIKSSFPGKSLYDTYEFKDEDKSKKTNVEVNGTTMN